MNVSEAFEAFEAFADVAMTPLPASTTGGRDWFESERS
jgi:hypothetical protein